MRRYRFGILTGMLLLLGVSAQAVVVPDLYSAQVPVNSQAASVRSSAVLKAFKTVLVKVSGDSSVLENAAIKAEFTKASNYLQDYSYQKPSGDDQASSSLLFQANFSDSAINQLLKSNGLTIWQSNRPLTLIWMVVEDQQGQTLVHDSESQLPAVQLLEQALQLRGLPNSFPLMDLSDTLQVTASDVTALDPQTIINASTRYTPDAILLLYVDLRTPTAPTAHWQLVLGQSKMRWETDGQDLSNVIQTGVDDIADALASHFTAVPTQQAAVDLTLIVNQLAGVSSYAELMDYLNGLSGVQSVSLLSLTPDSAKFKVSVKSSLATFEQMVKLDGRLELVSQDETTNISVYNYSGKDKD